MTSRISCSLPDLHKTPIPNTFSGIMYTKQWPLLLQNSFDIIIICQKCLRNCDLHETSKKNAGVIGNDEEANGIASQNIQNQ